MADEIHKINTNEINDNNEINEIKRQINSLNNRLMLRTSKMDICSSCKKTFTDSKLNICKDFRLDNIKKCHFCDYLTCEETTMIRSATLIFCLLMLGMMIFCGYFMIFYS